MFSPKKHIFYLTLAENEITEDGIDGEPYFEKLPDGSFLVGGIPASAMRAAHKDVGGEKAVIILRVAANDCTRAEALYTHLTAVTASHTWHHMEHDVLPDGVPTAPDIYTMLDAYVDMPDLEDIDLEEFLMDAVNSINAHAGTEYNVARVMYSDDGGFAIFVEDKPAFILAAIKAAKQYDSANGNENKALADFYTALASVGSADAIYIS